MGDQMKEDGANRGDEKCVRDFGWEGRVARPLARPRRRWENINEMDLRKTGLEDVDRINLVQKMGR